MSIHVQIDRLVLHDMALAHADRPRLLTAIEHAIAEQVAAMASGAIADRAVPVIHGDPIALPGHSPTAAQLGALATGIAGAATSALTQAGGGTP